MVWPRSGPIVCEPSMLEWVKSGRAGQGLEAQRGGLSPFRGSSAAPREAKIVDRLGGSGSTWRVRRSGRVAAGRAPVHHRAHCVGFGDESLPPASICFSGHLGGEGCRRLSGIPQV